MITRYCLSLLKHFHGMGFVHRDLKPHNITFRPETMDIYLIDFGLAARYDSSRYSELQRVNFVGTIYFASRAAHKKLQQTPRDDVEAFVFTLVYVTSTLPWRGIPVGEDKHDRLKLMKEEFLVNMEKNASIHDIIKQLAREILDQNLRNTPFDYDRFIGILDTQIADIKNKVSHVF